MAPLDPSKHKDLFAVTDNVRKLKDEPQSVTQAQYAAILGQLCNALSTSIDNGDLKDACNADALADDEKEKARRIVQDTASFLEFLKFENEVLQKCGVTPQTADDIVKQISPLQKDLQRFDFKPDEIFERISTFRTNACTAANDSRGRVQSITADYEAMKRAKNTYGTALIAANAAGVAMTMGAGTPYLSLSAAAGGLLLHQARSMENKTHKPLR